MIALKKQTKYPFNNSKLRWVQVEPCVWNRATIQPHESYIFVDKDTKQHLDDNNIVLEWSRFRKHIQTAAIQTIGGLTPKTMRKRSKDAIKTFAEIVSGTRGKHRGPRDTFHANDWTRAAFDKNAKKFSNDNCVAQIISNAFEHDLVPPPNHLFDLQTGAKRFIPEMDVPPPPELKEILDVYKVVQLVKKPDITTDLRDIIEEFDDAMKGIFPPPTPPPWHQNPTILSVIGLVTLLIIAAIWIA